MAGRFKQAFRAASILAVAGVAVLTTSLGVAVAGEFYGVAGRSTAV